MACGERVGIPELVEPIGAGIIFIAPGVLSPVVGRLSGVECNDVLDLLVLICIEEVGHLVNVGKTKAAVVRYLYFARLALLGGDEDDAISGARTVDGAGCGVLQYVDPFDVCGVERIDVAAGNTVNYVDRSCGTIGTRATDANLETVAGLTRIGLDVDAGRLALERTEHLGGVHLLDVVTLDFHGGTGDQFFLLDAIADYDHFVEFLIVLAESEVKDSSTAVSHRRLEFHVLVADERGRDGL